MKLELEESLPLGAFEEGSGPSGSYPRDCRPQVLLTWCTALEEGQASSRFPLHWLLKAEFAPGGDDGQAALQVVADEVADTVKDPVLCPDRAFRVHQQQMLGLAVVHSREDEGAWVGGALSDQEVSILLQQPLCLLPTHLSLVPRLGLQLLQHPGIWGSG